MAEETQTKTQAQGAAKDEPRKAAAERRQAFASPRSVVERAAAELADRLETAETTDDLSMPENGVVFTPGYPAPTPPQRGALRSDRPLVHLGGGRYKPDDVSTIADLEPVVGETPTHE